MFKTLVSESISLVMGHRGLTGLLSVLAVLALAAGAGRLVEVNSDVRNHFAPDDPHLLALKRVEDLYALSGSVLVVVAPNDGDLFSRQALVAVEELTAQLWLTPYATRVDSITNHSHSESRGDDLNVSRLIDDAGSLTESDIERVERIALGTEEIAGRLVSRDGRVAGLVVSVAFPDENVPQAKVEIVDALRATLAAARGAHPAIDYHMAGELVLNRAMDDAVGSEMAVLGPVALGTMLLLAVVLLKSLSGGFAILLMMIAVVLSGLGFVGWTGMKLFGESMAAFFVLLAVTVAHSVHIIEGMAAGLRQGLDRGPAIAQSLEVNFKPVFLTSLTTAIGFLSLNFAEMPPFKVMGNMVAFGAFCAFVHSVTLLPVLLSVLPIKARPLPAGKTDVFDVLGRFVVSHNRVLLVSFAVLAALLIAGIARIELKENWLELLDERYEFRQSADFISENYAGVETFEYSLDAGQAGGVTELDYLTKVDALSEWFRAQPEVTHVFGLADVMKRLNRNLNGDDPNFYRTPDSTDLAAQYLLLYELSLPIGRDLNNLIDVDRSSTRLTVALKSLSTREKIALDERAQDWFREHAPEMAFRATGVAAVGARSIQRNTEGMLVGTGTAMAIVSLLLLLVFRSVRLGLITLIPNFIPAAAAMGLWGYLVGEIGVAASVVTAIAFGIIVDDTIHFMTKYQQGRERGLLPSQCVQSAFRGVGRALFVTTMVFALGFLVFGASGMVTNQALGLLVAIAVIFALVADFLLLPPVLMALDGAGETSEQIRERLKRDAAEIQGPATGGTQ